MFTRTSSKEQTTGAQQMDKHSLMSCVWSHFPAGFSHNAWTALSAHSDFIGSWVSACYIQFSSRWYLCARKSPHALHPVSQKFPQCCLWNSSNWDNGPFSSFQGRSSSHTSLLQAVSGVMFLALCPCTKFSCTLLPALLVKWQGCLCTTAVMLEWNRYQNKLTLENKILLSLLPFKPITFCSRVWRSTAEQLQRSIRVKHHVKSQVSLIFCLWHASPHVGRGEEEKKLNELER